MEIIAFDYKSVPLVVSEAEIGAALKKLSEGFYFTFYRNIRNQHPGTPLTLPVNLTPWFFSEILKEALLKPDKPSSYFFIRWKQDFNFNTYLKPIPKLDISKDTHHIQM